LLTPFAPAARLQRPAYIFAGGCTGNRATRDARRATTSVLSSAIVTRNGKPAAALVPIDEYEALEETEEILSDPATLAAIAAGLADLARGNCFSPSTGR